MIATTQKNAVSHAVRCVNPLVALIGKMTNSVLGWILTGFAKVRPVRAIGGNAGMRMISGVANGIGGRTMDDLISRAAAIEYLMTNMGWHDEDGYSVDDSDEKRAIITDLVNGIPAVDAVPVVHGRWVSKSEEGIYGPTYCSICDFELRIDDMPYCPMCGAKMDEGART